MSGMSGESVLNLVDIACRDGEACWQFDVPGEHREAVEPALDRAIAKVTAAGPELTREQALLYLDHVGATLGGYGDDWRTELEPEQERQLARAIELIEAAAC